jgi:hypothetical protein
MNDVPTGTQTEEQPAPPAMTGSLAPYHEQSVFIQLREEMFGVSYPNAPVTDENGNPIGTRLLRGTCLVHAEEKVIELRAIDPLRPPRPGDNVSPMFVVSTLIPRDLIAFISRVEPVYPTRA